MYELKSYNHDLQLERQIFTSKNCNSFSLFTSQSHNFLTNRVTTNWNHLPSKVVEATDKKLLKNTNSFKNLLDKCF
jgi:hypothetical protein